MTQLLNDIDNETKEQNEASLFATFDNKKAKNLIKAAVKYRNNFYCKQKIHYILYIANGICIFFIV